MDVLEDTCMVQGAGSKQQLGPNPAGKNWKERCQTRRSPGAVSSSAGRFCLDLELHENDCSRTFFGLLYVYPAVQVRHDIGAVV